MNEKTSIRECGFSNRIQNRLISAKIYLVKDLLGVDLFEIKGISSKSRDVLEQFIINFKKQN
jgi:hypothetical protein